MPVKNYQSVGGRIISERSGGVRVDYLTDALGSVTCTVDQSQNASSPHRYAGYGKRITASTPAQSFQWVGAWGYRRSAVSGLDYARARYFRSESSAWTSVDRLWPKQHATTYVDARPTFWVDPTGASGGFFRFTFNVLDSFRSLLGPVNYNDYWTPPVNQDDGDDPTTEPPRPINRNNILECGWILSCASWLASRRAYEDSLGIGEGQVGGDKADHFVGGCLAEIRCGSICPDNVGTWLEYQQSISGGTVSRTDALATQAGFDFARGTSFSSLRTTDIEYCILGARIEGYLGINRSTKTG